KKFWPLLLLLLAVGMVFVFPGSGGTSAGSDEGGQATRGARGTRRSEEPEAQRDDVAAQGTVVERGGPPGGTGNLLVNPDFSEGFNGWNSVNGHWLIHPTNCDSDIWPPEMAEMDQDKTPSGVQGWRVGDEDWLWQDVTVLQGHDELTFTIYESHHMRGGIAETRIYGSDDGAHWTELWHREQPEPEADGAGKQCQPVPSYRYVIPLSRSYPFYRLEFHGKMVVDNDGWIFSWLSLTVNGEGPAPEPD